MFTNGVPDLTTLYDTRTLLGIFEDIRRPQNFWRSLATGGAAPMIFETESIMFEKTYSGRKAAPYVLPMSDGVPSYDVQSDVIAVKPAFIKLSDSVSPKQYIFKQPGQIVTLDQSSPAAREAAVTARILQHQRDMYENTMEAMAAEIMLEGSLLLRGKEYPERFLDFERDPSLDITVAPADEWDQPGVDIIGQICAYAKTMFDVKHGSAPVNIVMDDNAFMLFKNNPQIRELLSLDIRNSPADFNIGVMQPEDFQQVGVLNAMTFGYTMNLWVNRQRITVPDPVTGAPIDKKLMPDNTILLVGREYQAMEAYGVIPNAVAMGLSPIDVLVRSYMTDGANIVRHIALETAPIMFPIHENRTMRVKIKN